MSWLKTNLLPTLKKLRLIILAALVIFCILLKCYEFYNAWRYEQARQAISLVNNDAAVVGIVKAVFPENVTAGTTLSISETEDYWLVTGTGGSESYGLVLRKHDGAILIHSLGGEVVTTALANKRTMREILHQRPERPRIVRMTGE